MVLSIESNLHNIEKDLMQQNQIELIYSFACESWHKEFIDKRVEHRTSYWQRTQFWKSRTRVEEEKKKDLSIT
jgi:hypothetical protein